MCYTSKTECMKKAILTVILLTVCVQFSFAQNILQNIRERYNKQKDEIVLMNNDDQPKEYFQLRVMQNLRGTGAHEEDVRMYYSKHYALDDDDMSPLHILSFITVAYNFSAVKFYEEYLFDDGGTLCFFYTHIPAWTDDAEYECRCYFNKGNILQVSIKSRKTEEEEYKEVYTGDTIPKDFQERYKSYMNRVERYKKLFYAADGATCY